MKKSKYSSFLKAVVAIAVALAFVLPGAVVIANLEMNDKEQTSLNDIQSTSDILGDTTELSMDHAFIPSSPDEENAWYVDNAILPGIDSGINGSFGTDTPTGYVWSEVDSAYLQLNSFDLDDEMYGSQYFDEDYPSEPEFLHEQVFERNSLLEDLKITTDEWVYPYENIDDGLMLKLSEEVEPAIPDFLSGSEQNRRTSSLLNSGSMIYVDDDNTEGPWDGTIEHPYQYIQDGIDAAALGDVVDDNTEGHWDGNTVHPCRYIQDGADALPKCSYQHIQDGINAASNDDTVFVFNGTYNENIVVNKSIDLVGEDRGNTIIDGGGAGDVVYVTVNEVSINSFTMRNGSSGVYCYGVSYNGIVNCDLYDNGCGIMMSPGHGGSVNNNHIINCNCYGNSYGIYLFGGNAYIVGSIFNNHIINCTCHDNSQDGILLDGGYGSSVSNNYVINCTCYNSSHGGIRLYQAWIGSTENNYIINCTCYNISRYGIEIYPGEQGSAENNYIINCTCYNNYHGILLYGGSDFYSGYLINNHVINCSCYYNDRDGILLEAGSGPIVNNNRIVNCSCYHNGRDGIRLEGSTSMPGYVYNNYIINCACSNNSRGIYIMCTSSNTLSGNVLCDNVYGFDVVGKTLAQFYHDIDSSNMIDGKSIYYLVEESDLEIQDFGFLGLISCNDITVKNTDVSGSGMLLVNTHHSTISNVSSFNASADGVFLWYSSYNTIMNCDFYNNPRYGIHLDSSSYNNIINCTCYNNSENGIYIYGYKFTVTDNNNIINCSCYDNLGHGIYIYGWRSPGKNVRIINCTCYNNLGHGIYIYAGWEYYVDNTRIINCTCYNNTYGFFLKVTWNSTSDDLHIINCTSYDNIYGFFLYGASDTSSINCTSYNNHLGIYIFGECERGSAENNCITNCDLYDNSNDGILLYGKEENQVNNTHITHCNLHNNHNGVCINSSSNSTITRNNITDNNIYGIYLNSSSSNNHIYHNNFIDNTVNAYDECMSQWDNGYPAGGNYWSDYTGCDDFSGPDQNILGSDGIGDTPYNISGSGGNQDHYPFMSPQDEWNDPPYMPSNPYPENGSTGVPVDVDLSWTGDDPDPGDAVTYDVYLGTTTPPLKVASNQSFTSYDPGILDYETMYYWMIVAWDSHNVSTAGPVWSFTTRLEDIEPPVTTCTLDPEEPDGLNGWYVCDVEVTLEATDDLSGVDYTKYRVDDGDWQTYDDSFTVSTDGDHTVYYYSVDNFGNVEDVESVGFNIDQTAPDIIRFTVKKIGFRKWLLSVDVDDPTSGVAKVEFYIDDELVGEVTSEPWEYEYTGTGEFAQAIVYDNAGNSAASEKVESQSQGNNLVYIQGNTNILGGKKL